MSRNSNKVAAFIFLAIGIFLVIYSWAPSRSSLTEEQGKIVRIVPHRATRYNVEIITPTGNRLSCKENALRQWPPGTINRCPIEKFSPLVGKNITVLHDGRFIYEAKFKGNTILSHRVFRHFQVMMDIMALLMIGIGVVVWRRSSID
ncbi:MAG: hypothetical protein P794_08705 [Epsilonproteobacteria bacterium (ex Lamellibrachia satsuma)]|nr:MAG: hypothetical protein P794_08705 [Epsilonproteobacteria bacterium (ex Lamellibrachia satsuma)]